MSATTDPRGQCDHCYRGIPAGTLTSIRVVARRDPEDRRTLRLCQTCIGKAAATWRLRWEVVR